MNQYKLIFANQSINTTKTYSCIRETKMYVFLSENNTQTNFVFRVHKNTLNVKGIKEGLNGYKFDVPTAISLIKM